ncbi:MAG: GNAT family N-acetyltransferase [Dysgonamonadaceae bacterium]
MSQFIRYADASSRDQIRDMWKTVFGDPDNYMDLYFERKYRDENTLAYFIDDKAVSSLQMLSYNFTFCDIEIPVTYIAGVCTLPEYRKKGYMGELLNQALEELSQKNIPLAILVPQEDWLLEFYKQYGFAQTFDAGTEELPNLNELIHRNSMDLEAAYKVFHEKFRHWDMTVQKTFEDFIDIVDEATLFHFPPKKNLRGMARIIDAEQMLQHFVTAHPEKAFNLSVVDELLPMNNAGFMCHMGHVEKNPSHSGKFTEVDIQLLAQLLLGYHTSGLDIEFRLTFPEKKPQINFMLE